MHKKILIYTFATQYGDPLAQLVEHNTFNVGVSGSSPERVTERGQVFAGLFLFLYLTVVFVSQFCVVVSLAVSLCVIYLCFVSLAVWFCVVHLCFVGFAARFSGLFRSLSFFWTAIYQKSLFCILCFLTILVKIGILSRFCRQVAIGL